MQRHACRTARGSHALSQPHCPPRWQPEGKVCPCAEQTTPSTADVWDQESNRWLVVPQVIGLEKALRFFWEQRIQHFFLRWPDFVRFWNVYYWVAHGSNTIGALLALFFIRPAIYQVRVPGVSGFSGVSEEAALTLASTRSLLGACKAVVTLPRQHILGTICLRFLHDTCMHHHY
jgi:hypothetical protein